MRNNVRQSQEGRHRVVMNDADGYSAGEMISPAHLAALRLIHERLDKTPIVWVVTGSLGFAVRGMDVVVHDIDVQSDREGAYRIEHLFQEFVIEPVRFSSTAAIRSHFGALLVSGIRVEIMGDIEKWTAGACWEPPVELERPREWVTAHGMDIPVLSLEHESRAYRTLGRVDQADRLKRWMAEA